MTTKRALLKKLKEHRGNPHDLRVTAPELDELICLLGGSRRPPHRPKVVTAWGEHERTGRAFALADAVFEEMRDGDISRAEAIRQVAASMLEAHTKPKPADAATVARCAKYIESELDWLRKELGLKRLGLDEWVDYSRKTHEAELVKLVRLFADSQLLSSSA